MELSITRGAPARNGVLVGSDTIEYRAMQTILVIDDDESLRDTIGVMLEQEGFRAVLAGDGREGFEMAVSLKPDLMLVDLRLPGMSGTEICKQLRAANVATPIIVLSAMGDEIDKVLLLEIGADDYVVKPFGTRELMARIRAVLRRASADARKVVALLRYRGGFRTPHRQAQGRRSQAHSGGIQSALLFPAQSRPAAHARHDTEFGLGIRVLPEHAHGGCARGEVAPETGAGQPIRRVIF